MRRRFIFTDRVTVQQERCNQRAGWVERAAQVTEAPERAPRGGSPRSRRAGGRARRAAVLASDTYLAEPPSRERHLPRRAAVLASDTYVAEPPFLRATPTSPSRLLASDTYLAEPPFSRATPTSPSRLLASDTHLAEPPFCCWRTRCRVLDGRAEAANSSHKESSMCSRARLAPRRSMRPCTTSLGHASAPTGWAGADLASCCRRRPGPLTWRLVVGRRRTGWQALHVGGRPGYGVGMTACQRHRDPSRRNPEADRCRHDDRRLREGLDRSRARQGRRAREGERRRRRSLAHARRATPSSRSSRPRRPRRSTRSATTPRTSSRTPCSGCSPAPRSRSARRSRTASTTTSTAASRSPRTSSHAIEAAANKIVAADLRVRAHRGLARRRRSSCSPAKGEKFKVEIIEDIVAQGRQDR